MTEQPKPTAGWDERTVKECARRALGCRRDEGDMTPDEAAAGRRQAFSTYHQIMRLIEPDRTCALSAQEASKIIGG